MTHPGKRRFSVSTSTKVALGIVVVVAIVAYLYYQPGGAGFSLGGLEGIIGGGLTDIFSGAPAGERLDFTMTSSVSAFDDELVLENATVTLSGLHSADTVIGDSILVTSGHEAQVSFDGFNGRMTVDGGSASVDGTAAAAGSGGAMIRPKARSFSVSAALTPSHYSISPVTIDRIKLAGVSGSIERTGGESSTTVLSNSTVEITGFQGSVSFSGESYIVAGSATEIKGKSFTLKG